MKLPLRLQQEHPIQRWMAVSLIGLASAALVLLAQATPVERVPMGRLNDVLYDSLYHLRKPLDLSNEPIVIVAVDDASLEAVAKSRQIGWPWPRDFWAATVDYLNKSGAKAIAFDLLFSEPSICADKFDDDKAFADAVNKATTPVIFAVVADDAGKGRMAVPVDHPHLAAANATDGQTVRAYSPTVNGLPSLAATAVRAAGLRTVLPDRPFLLQYYGPFQMEAGHGRTFRYVQAAAVLGAAIGEKTPVALAASPDVFKDKIVLIGTVSAGTYDLRATPLSTACPGVDVQATAIENLMHDQRVHPAGVLPETLTIILTALAASLGAGVPRKVLLKLMLGILAVAAPLIIAAILFVGSTIIWLPPAGALQAGAIGLVGAFAYSYLMEDRQRQFFIRALSQYVSPHVADELSRNRSSLKIGSERREMTVMFTDIANFTAMSEGLETEQLGKLLNYYLDEMSDVVLSADGTLDKYVGDAIVTFWNAPLPQLDHASRACRAALAMRQREREIAPALDAMGGPNLYTRIGINSGTMAVGNMGSRRKFNYSVLGDAVNLGSRLEGANKMYGTRILISQSTADLVRGEFLVRKVDVLRVKGKNRPVAVYELMAEGPRDPDLIKLVHLYEFAFERYQAQDWTTAEQYLLEIGLKFPDDRPSKTLAERVRVYQTNPPAPGWDGVFVALEK